MTEERKPHGNTRHGKFGSGIYKAWDAMLQRCGNPNCAAYKDYGGRGISVCERWHSFENFYADMGDRPIGYSIERNDNDGNYEPGNCRWIPRSDQSRNQRTTKLDWEKVAKIRRLALEGFSTKEIAEMFGVSGKHTDNIINQRKWK